MSVPLLRWQFALCALLVIWIVISLAPLPWLFLNKASGPVVLPDVSAGQARTASDRSAVDIGKLQGFNLFGSADSSATTVASEPVEDTIEAEKTRLQIQLMGIVAASETGAAMAVIAHQNQQAIYAVGEALPVGNRVKLAKVMVDHVIIDNNGRYESLWLYDEDKDQPNAVAGTDTREGQQTDLRDRGGVTSLARDYRQRLYKNPASLAQVVRINPAMVDGQAKGFEVNPGSDREQFAAFGLKPGDVVTAINDMDLTTPAQAVEAYKLMREATEAVFTIERDGQPVQISVSLGNDN